MRTILNGIVGNQTDYTRMEKVSVELLDTYLKEAELNSSLISEAVENLRHFLSIQFSFKESF